MSPDCWSECGETGGDFVPDQQLEQWALSNDMWRISEKLNLRYVDWGFRIGAHRMPVSIVGRLYTLGIPPEVVHSTLKSIRSMDSWSSEWVETAQQYLGNYRREISAGNKVEAERARHLAGMCYQAAQILELSDVRTRNSCRAWASSLYRQSLPTINQNARHFTIPWNDRELPVLFEVPEFGDGPFGLVIMLNGLSLSKEETFGWAPRFLQAGFAVMAVDSPGTGEATSLGPVNPHYTDILDGVFDLLRNESTIDLNQVALVGASLGGNEAVRIARRNPQIMAVVAVTPAVEPTRWIQHASPMLMAELREFAEPEASDEVSSGFDILDMSEQMSQPMLIFGAARDVVVPPNEAQRLAERLGERSTFIWYPELGHCLYLGTDQWTMEAAAWLTAVAAGKANGVDDAATLASMGAEVISQVEWQPPVEPGDPWEEDEIGEYARIINPDEVES